MNLYRNGALLLGPVTDATTASGRVGLRIFQSAGGTVGDIELDDFSAGDFTTTGPKRLMLLGVGN